MTNQSDADRLAALIEKLFDPVRQAESAIRLAGHERTRTDPFRYYCRICGDQGAFEGREARDEAAAAHLALCRPLAFFPERCSEESGHLLHVWAYRPYQP